MAASWLGAQPFWAKDVGGIGNDHVADVKVDADGSIYMTGEFGGTMTFGGQTFSSAGSLDFFVAKLNGSGDLIWFRTGGGTGIDRGLKVGLGTGTNLVFTGEFLGTATFQAQTITSTGGTADMFVAVLQKSDGALQWMRQGGGATGTDRPYGVSMAADGRVAVAGEFRGTAQWEGSSLSSAVDPDTGQPNSDVFVVSYTAGGGLQWLKHGRAKYADRAIDVVHNAAGELYVTGQFSDTIVFDQSHANVQFNATFLVKFDAVGSEVWFRRMTGAGLNQVRDMLCKPDGRLLLVGDLQGTMIYFGTPQVNVVGGDPYAYYLIEVDAGGQLLAQSTVGSLDGVSVGGVDERGGMISVLGQFNCQFTDLAALYGSGVFMAVGDEDLFVTKHAGNGLALIEGQQFGGRSAKTPGQIASLLNGDVVFCGSYERNLIFPAVMGFTAEIGTWLGSIQGNAASTYCNDNAYGVYAGISAEALNDGFLARGYVPGREPYDWWRRTGAGCDRVELEPCIRQGAGECQDTVRACGAVLLNVRLEFSNSASSTAHFLGPEVDYLWSTGSTAATISAPTTGAYWVRIRSRNACYEWTDTIQVIIDPLPPLPVVSDDVVVNVNAVNPELIELCHPETHWVWAGNLAPGNQVYWVAPEGGGAQVFNDSIIVDTTGIYTVYTVSPDGCTRQNDVQVIDHPSPELPDLDVDLQITYPQDEDGNDTLQLCYNNPIAFQFVPTWTVNGVPAPLPDGLTMHWDFIEPPMQLGDGGMEITQLMQSGSGWYVHELVVRVTNKPCGQDSIYFHAVDSIYVDGYPQLDLDIWIDGPSAICDGDTALLVAGCTGCDQIDWSGTGLIPAGIDSMFVATAGGVSVQTSIEDEHGCSYSATASLGITIPIGPLLDVLPANGIICPGQTASLSTTMVGTDHVWYGPSGPITGEDNTLVISVPGDYYLIMNVSGCPVTSNSVTLVNYGTPYLDAAPLAALCSLDDEVTLQVVATTGSSVVWGPPLSGSGVSQTIGTPGIYTCEVSACGITTQLSIEITLSDVSAAVGTGGPYTLCNGDSVLLQGNTTAEEFFWLPGEQATPAIMVSTSGSYTFVAVDEAGCADTSAAVLVTAISFPDPVVASGDTVCAGQAAQLTASGSGNMMWYADAGGTQPLGSGELFAYVVQVSTVVHVVQEEGGCSGGSVAVPVIALPLPPAPIIQGPDSLCAGLPLVVQVTVPDSVGVQWSTPGGTFTTPTITIPVAALDDSGLYTCSTTYNGCSSTSDLLWIEVMQPEEPGLPQESLLCTGGIVHFTLPAGFTAPQWSTGSTGYSIGVTSGMTVQLDALDIHGCAVRMDLVVVEDDCELVVPNIFTPNGDGSNESWLPRGGFVSANAQIYNRWGGLVHEGDMVRAPWRGKHYTSGEACSEGVYFYVLSFVRSDGSSIERSGYVQLNR
ncbi:MAG TPA: gliding motility-associated C-terminal domain-containing protein [Flavobacteriales bacterium]